MRKEGSCCSESSFEDFVQQAVVHRDNNGRLLSEEELQKQRERKKRREDLAKAEAARAAQAAQNRAALALEAAEALKKFDTVAMPRYIARGIFG